MLLHTFIDSLRQEEDREINHHGKAIAVDGEGGGDDDADGEEDMTKIDVDMASKLKGLLGMGGGKSDMNSPLKNGDSKVPERPNYYTYVCVSLQRTVTGIPWMTRNKTHLYSSRFSRKVMLCSQHWLPRIIM